MSHLTAVRTAPAGKTKARKPRGKARVKSRSECPVASVADIADALDQAVEANRDAARERDVRIACAVLDPLPVVADDQALLGAMDAMLASAIANCVWGSRIECSAVPLRDRIVVRIRFLKPGADQSPWAVDDGELCGAWLSATAIGGYGSNEATSGA